MRARAWDRCASVFLPAGENSKAYELDRQVG